jgi:hypothetical protein
VTLGKILAKARRKRSGSLQREVKALVVKFVTPTTVTAAMTLATAIITLAPILKWPLEVEKVVPLETVPNIPIIEVPQEGEKK